MKRIFVTLLALVLMLACLTTASACTPWCGSDGPFFDTDTKTEEELQLAALQRISANPTDIIGKDATVVHYGNIRTSPNKYSDILTQAPKDTVYRIESYQIVDGGVWLQIRYGTGTAWISASLVEISGEFDKPDGRIGMNIRIIVNSGRARMNPGTDSPILEYVRYNEEYRIYNVGNAPDGTTWFQIKKGGKLCWISSSIVSFD